ncbi:MAG TPA: CmcJ/NvfI family oxidoreductase [Methylomirabilota bacterium]|jgi:hypothetical protein|nr:CmcJ/NvfI family oxidoreductase [Methylomirabilota bacterium]
MSTNTPENLAHVNAQLNYLADMDEKPRTYMYKPPEGVPERTGRVEPRPMPVYDGRSILDELSLDKNGFMLMRHETKVTNFYDEQEVKRVYYPEVEQLLKDLTGAVKVLVFDHNVRCRTRAKQGEPGVREPVRVMHNDYTLKSGPQRVRDLLPPDEAEMRLQHRFAFINVWRPITGPVLEAPLAVCDGRSIAQKDFVPTDLIYRDRLGEVYMAAFNPAHRWFYFPRMQPNEALLLKCYDSMDDGRARYTAHGAFDDPTAPPDAPARESVEVRTIVFFAPEDAATR